MYWPPINTNVVPVLVVMVTSFNVVGTALSMLSDTNVWLFSYHRPKSNVGNTVCDVDAPNSAGSSVAENSGNTKLPMSKRYCVMPAANPALNRAPLVSLTFVE